jgi:hypothetical protein
MMPNTLGNLTAPMTRPVSAAELLAVWLNRLFGYFPFFGGGGGIWFLGGV